MGTYSDAEIAFIKAKIRNLKDIVRELECDNDKGQYTAEIRRLKNEIIGLEYTLSGKN